MFTSELDQKTIGKFNKFLDLNKSLDLKTFNFLLQNNVETLEWKSNKKTKPAILNILKAYQRLLRVMPEDNSEIILGLLKKGIHSAIQIANMSKKQFIKMSDPLFKDKLSFAEQIHKNSQKKRSKIALQYINVVQNKEPHILASRINK